MSVACGLMSAFITFRKNSLKIWVRVWKMRKWSGRWWFELKEQDVWGGGYGLRGEWWMMWGLDWRGSRWGASPVCLLSPACLLDCAGLNGHVCVCLCGRVQSPLRECTRYRQRIIKRLIVPEKLVSWWKPYSLFQMGELETKWEQGKQIIIIMIL